MGGRERSSEKGRERDGGKQGGGGSERERGRERERVREREKEREGRARGGGGGGGELRSKKHNCHATSLTLVRNNTRQGADRRQCQQ